jgi:L-amino acid N-acyltransferase YncA
MPATLRDAQFADLPRIVEIYNAAIPGRLATADTLPITVASREAWFVAHRPDRRPLWVLEQAETVIAWLGVQDFYGRPAYGATAELSLYVAPEAQHQGCGSQLMTHVLQTAPELGITTLLGFVFGHNQPSLGLCAKFGFVQWGLLPGVAQLDGELRDLVILGRRVGNESVISP